MSNVVTKIITMITRDKNLAYAHVVFCQYTDISKFKLVLIDINLVVHEMHQQ